MSGSSLGKLFTVTTWGESHGVALGVVIDGCPAGVSLDTFDIQIDLDRRKPGASVYTTARNEGDKVTILSGVFEGKTTGTPISLVVYNQDHHSADYSNISHVYRPGHADFTFDKKFGIRDYRGGGRSSGRETIARVAAGAVAKKVLQSMGVSILAYTKSIGNISIDEKHFDVNEISKNKLCMPDSVAAQKAALYIEDCIKNADSVGGIVECVVTGLPCGIGEPVFDKLDALLGQAMFSIGAVKGVEFGIGFAASTKKGSELNDEFCSLPNNAIGKLTNNSGGILGGISDGADVVINVAFKPTPSIAKTQHTVNDNAEEVEINIRGRHDPVIVPRAVVVVEAMAAITITDLLFQNLLSNINTITSFYNHKGGTKNG